MKFRLRSNWSASTLARDLLSTLVVFLVALPLCMGFAKAAGLSAEKGAMIAVAGGLIVVASLRPLKRRELDE